MIRILHLVGVQQSKINQKTLFFGDRKKSKNMTTIVGFNRNQTDKVYMAIVSIGIALLIIPAVDYTFSDGSMSMVLFTNIEKVLIMLTGGRSHSQKVVQ